MCPIMAQVTIYLPDELEREVKRAAKRAHKSVSAYLAELAAVRTRSTTWPKGFASLYGSCDLPEVEDRPPEDVETLP